MGEFELIEAICRMSDRLPKNGFEGIGDDCAVLEIGGGEALVFTADALCEGVHFLREGATAYEIGQKTLRVNLSDVASMGVRPVAVLLSLSLPDDLPQGWAEAFMVGLTEDAARYGVALIGGDTTRTTGGIHLSVTAIGRGAVANLKRRRDAQKGDRILVTAPLGGSAHGLKDILAGRLETAAATTHRLPEIEIEAGAWLGARSEVHAMMDLSDGLASDIHHILKASDAGAAIDLDRLPLDAGATIEEAAAGGEDYKLLITASEEGCDELMRDFEAAFNRPLYIVGEITDEGLVWREKGKKVERELQGFRHF